MRATLTRWPLRLAGAGLLTASAAVHLDLYLTGYRTIPVIGPLFLLQVLAALALSLAILALPLTSMARADEPLLAATAAGFAIATLGGYLLSLWVGLFGFREVRTTAGITAGILEIAAFAALAALAVLGAGDALAGRARRAPGGGSLPAAGAGSLPAAGAGSLPAALRRAGGPSVAILTVAALAVFGASAATARGSQPPAAPAGARALLRTATIGGVPVLTNSSGRTLYWFAPDTPSHSACSGECAAYWPPVTGSPAAGPGVTGRLGTIRRSDATTQATYDGHPLYTYIGDTAPGQASGNNINLNGGLWHEVPVAG
jgi:predicted lipoprotein with Yx(FWY)xxD motif